MKLKRSSQTLAIEERLTNHQSAKSIALVFGLTHQRVSQIQARMQRNKVAEDEVAKGNEEETEEC